MVFKLSNELIFPNPHYGEEDGLLAIGGDLCVDLGGLRFIQKIFPWYSFDFGEPRWYCPLNRFVIFPKEIHISHSMRTLINKKQYRISIGEAFDGVLRGCQTVNNRDKIPGAWLGPNIIEAYTRLHILGFATSVEVWDGNTLVGGLYGVMINNCFIGESMFSLVPSASKLALIHLAHLYEPLENSFIDCQFETPHLKSMGGRYISYEEYMNILKGEN